MVRPSFPHLSINPSCSVVMVAARGRVGGRDRQIVTNMMLGGRSLGMVLGSGLGLLLVNLL